MGATPPRQEDAGREQKYLHYRDLETRDSMRPIRASPTSLELVARRSGAAVEFFQPEEYTPDPENEFDQPGVYFSNEIPSNDSDGEGGL
jgi:hypothetical protein